MTVIFYFLYHRYCQPYHHKRQGRAPALRNNNKIHHLNVGNGLDHSAMLFHFRQYRHKRNAQERSLQNTTHIHRADLNRKIINYQLSIINFKKDVVM